HTPLVHPHLYTLSLHDALPISLELYYTENISPLETITPGVGQGELIGGNLSVLTRTIGTQFEIETAGKLLLIEDIGEEPARVDRSEEHTSELQSRFDLVCRLLL